MPHYEHPKGQGAPSRTALRPEEPERRATTAQASVLGDAPFVGASVNVEDAQRIDDSWERMLSASEMAEEQGRGTVAEVGATAEPLRATRPPPATTVAPEPDMKVIIDETIDSDLSTDDAEDTVVVARAPVFGNLRPWVALGGAGAVAAGLAIWAVVSAGTHAEQSTSQAAGQSVAMTTTAAPEIKAGSTSPTPVVQIAPAPTFAPPPTQTSVGARALTTAPVTRPSRPAASPAPAPKPRPKSTTILRDVPY